MLHGASARLLTGRNVRVGDRVLAGEVILLAPGSRPARPGAIPFDDPAVFDSERILDLPSLPRSLAVVAAAPWVRVRLDLHGARNAGDADRGHGPATRVRRRRDRDALRGDLPQAGHRCAALHARRVDRAQGRGPRSPSLRRKTLTPTASSMRADGSAIPKSSDSRRPASRWTRAAASRSTSTTGRRPPASTPRAM